MKLTSNLVRCIRDCRGFTLTELLFAASISVVVLTAGTGAYIYILRSWHGIDQRIQADTDLNIAINRIIYGMTDEKGIRTAVGVSLANKQDGWTLWYQPGLLTASSNSITYSKSAGTLVFNPGDKIIGRQISKAEITVYPRSLDIKLEADRKKAGLHVKRDIATRIYWRN